MNIFISTIKDGHAKLIDFLWHMDLLQSQRVIPMVNSSSEPKIGTLSFGWITELGNHQPLTLLCHLNTLYWSKLFVYSWPVTPCRSHIQAWGVQVLMSVLQYAHSLSLTLSPGFFICQIAPITRSIFLVSTSSKLSQTYSFKPLMTFWAKTLRKRRCNRSFWEYAPGRDWCHLKLYQLKVWLS